MLNFLKNLFTRQPERVERVQVMSGGPAIFTQFTGDAWQSDVYRAAVDAIARNASKLKITHVVNYDGKRRNGDSQLNRILQVRPNPYMSAADWLYKTIASYYVNNNAFSFLQRDVRGNIVGMWPMVPLQMEFVTDASNILYCRFIFAGGRTVMMPYTDVFHIRRHFHGNDLLGGSNTPVIPALDLANIQNEGMTQAIKAGANIRGLLRYNQVLSPEKLKQEQEAFIADYLSIANQSGVVCLDSKTEYVPLNSSPMVIDEKQLAAVETKIYKYLGISPEIVSSDYSEDQFSAFSESVLEPLGLLIGLELTEKILTQREQAFGNSILVEGSRMIFANNKTKVEALKQLVPMGLLTKNQALEVLNLPTVEDGDVYLQSLNFVDQSKINEYQGVSNNERNQNS